METKKQSKRGGSRKNAGAKPKYSEKTLVVSFRCPVSREQEFREIVGKILLSYKQSIK